MLEASEANELIDEAIERVEEREAKTVRKERKFRDRLSLLVGIFAVCLAVVHLVGAGLLRENVVQTIRASDAYNYMQAKKVRQVVLQVGRRMPWTCRTPRATASASFRKRPTNSPPMASGRARSASVTNGPRRRFRWQSCCSRSR